MPARPAAGTTLSVGAATDAPTTAPAGDTFSQILEIQSLDGPNAESPEIETTALESTGRTYISDLQDPGTLEFSINVDDADTVHRLLETDANTAPASRPVRNWQQVTAGGTTIDVVGYVQTFNRSAQAGSAYSASVTVRLSGSPGIDYPA